MSKIITLALLKDRGACDSQVALFESLFGESVELTLDLAREHALKFDVDWAASTLLRFDLYQEYDRRRAPFRRKVDREERPDLVVYQAEVAGPRATLIAERQAIEAEFDDVARGLEPFCPTVIEARAKSRKST